MNLGLLKLSIRSETVSRLFQLQQLLVMSMVIVPTEARLMPKDQAVENLALSILFESHLTIRA